MQVRNGIQTPFVWLETSGVWEIEALAGAATTKPEPTMASAMTKPLAARTVVLAVLVL